MPANITGGAMLAFLRICSPIKVRDPNKIGVNKFLGLLHVSVKLWQFVLGSSFYPDTV